MKANSVEFENTSEAESKRPQMRTKRRQMLSLPWVVRRTLKRARVCSQMRRKRDSTSVLLSARSPGVWELLSVDHRHVQACARP